MLRLMAQVVHELRIGNDPSILIMPCSMGGSQRETGGDRSEMAAIHLSSVMVNNQHRIN